MQMEYALVSMSLHFRVMAILKCELLTIYTASESKSIWFGFHSQELIGTWTMFTCGHGLAALSIYLESRMTDKNGGTLRTY